MLFEKKIKQYSSKIINETKEDAIEQFKPLLYLLTLAAGLYTLSDCSDAKKKGEPAQSPNTIIIVK